MGRIYTVALDALSVTNDADQDIIEMVNGANAAAVLHYIELHSAHTSDERCRLRLVRRSTTGTGGSAATENPLDGGDAAAGLAINTIVTTPGTIGAILKGWQWSQLAPLIYLPTPELRIVIPPSGRLCLNLQTALGGTRTWSGFACWEEIG